MLWISAKSSSTGRVPTLGEIENRALLFSHFGPGRPRSFKPQFPDGLLGGDEHMAKNEGQSIRKGPCTGPPSCNRMPRRTKQRGCRPAPLAKSPSSVFHGCAYVMRRAHS